MNRENKYLTQIKQNSHNVVEVKQAISYLRYSDPGQGDGYTIENQQDYCGKTAKRLGYEIIREFSDLGISGGTKAFSKRKGLLNLLRFCRKNGNHISALFVYKIDRLSRSNFIYANVKKELADQGIRIISATEETPDSPTGDTMQGIFALFAQWDNANRSMRATDGMRKRIENGLAPTAPAVGYLPNGKNKPSKNPKSFDLVKEGWDMIETGVYTVTQVAKHLRKKGLRTRYGGVESLVTAKALYRIFSNPYYAGFIRSSLMDRDYPGIHDKMVSFETFRKVQDILNSRGAKHRSHQKVREEFPLRGLVFCKCGKPFTGGFCKGKQKAYPYYLCRDRCVKPIRAEKMHEKFIELLEKIVPKKKFIDYYVSILGEKWKTRYTSVEKRKVLAKRRMTKIKAREKRLLNLRLEGEINKETYLEFQEQIKDEKLTCESELEESKIEKVDIDAAITFLKSFLANISKFWLEANVIQKRALLCLIFEEKLVFADGRYQTPSGRHDFTLKTAFRFLSSDPGGI